MSSGDRVGPLAGLVDSHGHVLAVGDESVQFFLRHEGKALTVNYNLVGVNGWNHER